MEGIEPSEEEEAGDDSRKLEITATQKTTLLQTKISLLMRKKE